MDNNNTRSLVAEWLVSLVGGLAVLAGGVGLVTASGERATYAVAVGFGLIVLVAARLNIRVATYVVCGGAILNSSLPLAANPGNNAILGYVAAIIIAGILLGGRIIIPATAVALLAYLAALSFAPSIDLGDALGGIMTVMVCGILVAELVRLLNVNVQQALARAGETQAANTKLARSLERDQRIARVIKLTADRLREIARQQAEGAQEQLAAVEQVRANSEAQAATAAQIAHSAREAAAGAERTLTSADLALRATDASREASKSSEVQAAVIATSGAQLASQIEVIGGAATLVGEVATETHLLALNASIEAAGAGAYGKRFSIIAEELTELSNSSAQQAQRIANNLTELNEANRASQKATIQGLAAANLAAEQSLIAAAANLAVIEEARRTKGQMGGIEQATEQQRNQSTTVAAAMQQVGVAARQTAEDANGILHEIEALLRLTAEYEQAEATSVNPDQSSSPEPPSQLRATGATAGLTVAAQGLGC